MKILIIRRDNIGDLILTTPLISELATSFDCKIDVLIIPIISRYLRIILILGEFTSTANYIIENQVSLQSA